MPVLDCPSIFSYVQPGVRVEFGRQSAANVRKLPASLSQCLLDVARYQLTGVTMTHPTTPSRMCIGSQERGMVEILLMTGKIECGVSPAGNHGDKNTKTLSVANTAIAERNQRMIAEG